MYKTCTTLNGQDSQTDGHDDLPPSTAALCSAVDVSTTVLYKQEGVRTGKEKCDCSQQQKTTCEESKQLHERLIAHQQCMNRAFFPEARVFGVTGSAPLDIFHVNQTQACAIRAVKCRSLMAPVAQNTTTGSTLQQRCCCCMYTESTRHTNSCQTTTIP